MHVFINNLDIPCVVADTREKAQEWIDKEMKCKEYNGNGIYEIREIKYYK